MRYQRGAWKLIYPAAIVLVLFIMSQTGADRVLRRGLFDFSRNFLTTLQLFFFHVTDGVIKVGDSVDVYRERDRLRIEVANLQRDLIRFEEARLENERLHALLEFKEKTQLKGVAARIIGRDLGAVSDMVVINRGEKDGITIGTVLMSQDGLVGHVVAVGKDHSRALLITDMKARVSVLAQGTRDVGVMEGTPTHLLKLKYVNFNSSIKIGDIVITAGFGDIFPKGIPVGTVQMIGTEANNLHLYALVKPFTNFAKLEEVLCLEKQ